MILGKFCSSPATDSPMHFMLPQCLLSDWSAERVRISGFQTHKELSPSLCVTWRDTWGESWTPVNIGQRWPTSANVRQSSLGLRNQCLISEMIEARAGAKSFLCRVKFAEDTSLQEQSGWVVCGLPRPFLQRHPMGLHS